MLSLDNVMTSGERFRKNGITWSSRSKRFSNWYFEIALGLAENAIKCASFWKPAWLLKFHILFTWMSCWGPIINIWTYVECFPRVTESNWIRFNGAIRCSEIVALFVVICSTQPCNAVFEFCLGMNIDSIFTIPIDSKTIRKDNTLNNIWTHFNSNIFFDMGERMNQFIVYQCDETSVKCNVVVTPLKWKLLFCTFELKVSAQLLKRWYLKNKLPWFRGTFGKVIWHVVRTCWTWWRLPSPLPTVTRPMCMNKLQQNWIWLSQK